MSDYEMTSQSFSPATYEMAPTDEPILSFTSAEDITTATATLTNLLTGADASSAISDDVVVDNTITLRLSGLADGSNYRLAILFTRVDTSIETRYLFVTVATPTASFGRGVSRREIRKTVAHMLSDYYDATNDVAGQTGSFRDLITFARETDHFKGMQIVFSNPTSANYGHIATVTRSDGPNRTIYFEPPLIGTTELNDTVEMYNFKGRGFTVSQYNATINDAISMARQQHNVIPHTMTVDTAFSYLSPYVDIPDTFSHFTGIEATDSSGRRIPVGPDHLRVDVFGRQVEVRKASMASRLNGRYVTIRGYVEPDLLHSDDHKTRIDMEWLLNEVKAQLLERALASGMPVGAQDRMYLQERNEASGKRGMIITSFAPNTVRLP